MQNCNNVAYILFFDMFITKLEVTKDHIRKISGCLGLAGGMRRKKILLMYVEFLLGIMKMF